MATTAEQDLAGAVAGWRIRSGLPWTQRAALRGLILTGLGVGVALLAALLLARRRRRMGGERRAGVLDRGAVAARCQPARKGGRSQSRHARGERHAGRWSLSPPGPTAGARRCCRYPALMTLLGIRGRVYGAMTTSGGNYGLPVPMSS
jgi:hypothetical protein